MIPATEIRGGDVIRFRPIGNRNERTFSVERFGGTETTSDGRVTYLVLVGYFGALDRTRTRLTTHGRLRFLTIRNTDSVKLMRRKETS